MRRKVLTATALPIAATLAAVSVAACSSGSSSSAAAPASTGASTGTASSATASTSASQQYANGQTATIILPSDPGSLDPDLTSLSVTLAGRPTSSTTR